MFKFSPNMSRPQQYLIISILGLILFSAGLVATLEVQSKKFASKTSPPITLEAPATAPADIPALKAGPSAKPVASKVATTKKTVAKAKTPTHNKCAQATQYNSMPGDPCYTGSGEVLFPAIGKLILNPTSISLEVGATIRDAVTIRSEPGKPIRMPSKQVEGSSDAASVVSWEGGTTDYRNSWTVGVAASPIAKPGIYTIIISAMGDQTDNTNYKATMSVQVIEKPSFTITATRLDDRTDPGYFAVRIHYSRIGNYTNPLPEPYITMQPDENSCELFDDGTDQYVFECDIEKPSPSYNITFSVTDYLGVTKSTNITITWP